MGFTNQPPGGAEKSIQSVITVFGDSHSFSFHPTQFYAGRLGLKRPLAYRVSGAAIPAASLAGFRPGRSTLGVKERVRAAVPNSRYMVLAFGQVDLELGYYYRLIVKGEKIHPEEYLSWLEGVYESFLEGLVVEACDIALKGVNLTALSPKEFASLYVSRIVTEKADMSTDRATEVVAAHILSEADQNDMHLAFNDRVRGIADRRGIRYFDLNDKLSDDGKEPRLSRRFMTAKFDHHLADTVEVRRMHYDAVGRVFGLT